MANFLRTATDEHGGQRWGGNIDSYNFHASTKLKQNMNTPHIVVYNLASPVDQDEHKIYLHTPINHKQATYGDNIDKSKPSVLVHASPKMNKQKALELARNLRKEGAIFNSEYMGGIRSLENPKYKELNFAQDSNANEFFHILNTDGEYEAIEHAKQWDFGDNHNHIPTTDRPKRLPNHREIEDEHHLVQYSPQYGYWALYRKHYPETEE